MFLYLYRARIKCLLKKQEILLISFGFPILLALVFYIGFYSRLNEERVDTISIGIVIEDKTNQNIIPYLEDIEINETKLFHLNIVNIQEAKQLLLEEKIIGWVLLNSEPSFVVNKNGTQEILVKSILDEYHQMDLDGIQKSYVRKDDNPMKSNYRYIHFYALVALSCLFGCYWGFEELQIFQGDLKDIGIRIFHSPIKKLELLISNLTAAITVHLTSILFLVLFLINVLNIDFGDNLLLIFVTCCLGSIYSIGIGGMVCVLFKVNIKLRKTILHLFIGICSFFSGIIIYDINYRGSFEIPLIKNLNPASMITEIFYRYYFYNDITKFYFSITLLGIFSLLFF